MIAPKQPGDGVPLPAGFVRRRDVYMITPGWPLSHDFKPNGYVHTSRECDGRFCIEASRGPLFYRIFVGNEAAAVNVHGGMVRALTRRPSLGLRLYFLWLRLIRVLEFRATKTAEHLAETEIDLDTLSAVYPEKKGWGRRVKIVVDPCAPWWRKP